MLHPTLLRGLLCLSLTTLAPALDRLGPKATDLEESQGPTLAGNANIADGKLQLGAGGSATFEVAIPAHPKAAEFDAAGWYGYLCVDVLAEGGALEVEVTRGAHTHRSKSDGPARRVELRLPAEVLGDTLRLILKSDGEVLLDGLSLERHHSAPTNKLLGKANGHLGPDQLACGALGFTAVTEHLQRAFSILSIEPGCAAEAAGLRVGDLVVAVEHQPLAASSIDPGWDWFERSHEATLGRAIEAALRAGRGTIDLRVLRSAGAQELSLHLPYVVRLDEGFPLTGQLATALHADLIDWTLEHQREDGSWPGTDAVNPSLGGLALLGTRNPEHREPIERAVGYMLRKSPKPSEMKGLAYWQISFQGIFFCEYYLASGDESVLPWISEAIEWLPTTTHECKWGMQAFGHGPDGLPYDNKALMACAAHLIVFDALARKCGVEAKVWEHIEPYVVHSWSDPEAGGHGAMGYNASYKDKGEFWSRSGLTALATALRGESGVMREKLCVIMAERHPWMLNSHAYGEPGAALGLIGLSVAHPPSFAEVMPQWGWRFLCNWQPGHGLRYSTPHMGAPYMGGESIVNLSYAVWSSIPSQGLVMTGGEPERWLAGQ
ncbi:MAG: DUF6288 domain-containing protein [Planctomycetota bacterium]|nr:DUF6288 domain-containing protein [Planctomycetota bacterium]